MVPPHAGDLVDQRLGRVRVGPHRLDREVGRDVGVHEGEEGREHEGELDEGGRLGDGHQALVALLRAPRGQRHLHQRGGKREDEGEMSELDDHGRRRAPAGRARTDPLSPCLFGNGERVRVRGGDTRRRSLVAAPHPDPLPVKDGERETCGARRRSQCHRHFSTRSLGLASPCHTPCSLRALATSGGM